MDDRELLDELAKLHLKLIRQKIDKEKSAGSWMPSSGAAGNAAGLELLQAEIFRGKQLERKIEEARENIHPSQNRRQPSEHENVKDILPVLMAQNVQLQQVVMQQMVKNMVSEKATSAQPQASQVPLELKSDFQHSTHREMTPFTGLPYKSNTKNAEETKRIDSRRERLNSRRRSSQTQRGVFGPVRPTERVLYNKPRVTPKAEGFLDASNEETAPVSYPFPGTTRIRKLRHVFYIVWFCVSLLKEYYRRRLEAQERLKDMIESVITELHKSYYLHSEGSILELLQNSVNEDSVDFNVKSPGMFQRLSAENKEAIDTLSFIIETVVNSIVEIYPTSGFLSPSREGVVWHMVQPGAVYPSDYLWQVEKDLLLLDDRGAVTTTDSQDAVVLVLGLFISRALVSTLLLDPVKSGLLDETPNPLASGNLKVLASVFMKIVREMSTPRKGKTMPQAAEIGSLLYSDEELKYLFKKLENTFGWSKTQLKRWADNYIESVRRS